MDIVERLRGWIKNHPNHATIPLALLTESAAEIERLQAALKPLASIAEKERRCMPDIGRIESVLVAWGLLEDARLAVEQSSND